MPNYTNSEPNISFGINANSKLSKANAGNIAFGKDSVKENENGFSITAFGYKSLEKIKTSRNIGIGANSGNNLEAGFDNIFVGFDTQCTKQTGSFLKSINMNHISLGKGANNKKQNSIVLGGTNKDPKSTGEDAIKALHSGITNYTDLGSEDFRFKKAFINDLYLNDGNKMSLPTNKLDKFSYVVVDNVKDNVVNLKYSKIKRVSGLILNTRANADPLKVEADSNGLATITLTNMKNAKGRLLLGSTTTKIFFDFTVEDFIKEFNLNKPFDFFENFLIGIDNSTSISLDHNEIFFRDNNGNAVNYNNNNNTKFRVNGNDASDEYEVKNDFSTKLIFSRLSDFNSDPTGDQNLLVEIYFLDYDNSAS